jgi:hypothetical protein
MQNVLVVLWGLFWFVFVMKSLVLSNWIIEGLFPLHWLETQQNNHFKCTQ